MSLRGTLGMRARDRLGIGALEGMLAAVDRDIGHIRTLLDGHQERIGRTERLIRIATVMAWIEQATLRTNPLVSVILPTRDRPSILPRAIESVFGQSYANWELIVCDDSEGEGTEDVVGTFAGGRVRYLPGEPSGAAAARNRGLTDARGELIAYLDDDNRMHPGWLKSVVWAFERRPDVEILYGGITIEDTARLHREPGHEMPSAWLEAYDREAVLTNNVADTSAIAHRASLADARFDESIRVMADWDFFLRMTADRNPLTLPAIACFYFTDAENRLSEDVGARRRDGPTITWRARAARGQ
jgi:glycosyltransferase involved in cell wall biosynthesis